MEIRPYGDRVLVKRVEESEGKTAGGLFIPDTAKEKPQQGEVLAVGEGKLTEDGKVHPIKVKAGDQILFGKYSGSDVPKAFGDDYILIREDEILAVLEGAPKVAKKAS